MLNVNASNIEELKILHIEDLPASCDYEIISTSLCSFGNIMEVRMNFLESDLKWEAWVTFENHEEAFKASCSIGNLQICKSIVRGSLTDKVHANMDIYKPCEWTPEKIKFCME